ncbi:MAG: hypothetical protein MK183_01455 [Verrucomicrobiales bacterium]|nr:hypothetical protein [Verrucomicrobiales bacterium]
MMRILLLFFLSVILPVAAVPDPDALKEAIKKNGGQIFSTNGTDCQVEFHLTGRRLDDAGLVTVGELKDTVILNLRDTGITDAGLAHLKGLNKLRRLHLERTAVGDEGIAHLSNLHGLEYLNLYSSKITDKALDHLAGLKNLRQLFVWQTGVTEEGVAKLQKALPTLRIIRGVDLDKVAAEAAKPKEEPKPLEVLTWMAVDGSPLPKSNSGDFLLLHLENQSGKKVKLYWVNYGGGLQYYADIAAGDTREQTTYTGATWLIADADDNHLGYFRTKQKNAKAVIPKVTN